MGLAGRDQKMLALSLLMLMQVSSEPPPTISLPTGVTCEGRSDAICVQAKTLATAIVEGRYDIALASIENGTTLQLGTDKGVVALGQGSVAARSLLNTIKTRAEPPRSFLCRAFLQQLIAQCYLFVGARQGMNDLSMVITLDQGSPRSLMAAIVPREFAVGEVVPCRGSDLEICRTFERFGKAIASLDAAALSKMASIETTVDTNGADLPFPRTHFPSTEAGWRSALESVQPLSEPVTTTCFIGRRLNTQASDADTGLCQLAITGTDTVWLTSMIKLRGGRIVEVNLIRATCAKSVIRH